MFRIRPWLLHCAACALAVGCGDARREHDLATPPVGLDAGDSRPAAMPDARAADLPDVGVRAADGSSAEPPPAEEGRDGAAPAGREETLGSPAGFYRMETLSRGLVALQTPRGVYVGFRMSAGEYAREASDPVQYELLRDGMALARVTQGTNYLDPGGSAASRYSVRAVIDGTTLASAPVGVWPQGYLRIALEPPAAGRTPDTSRCEKPDEAYQYEANDGSVGDVDGDGEYELFLKWDPSNAKDNSQSGCTGHVFLDAYRLSGARLWRIDLGPNIRAGAHYTQFLVYDLDGDGSAELAVKTAPGSRDGSGAFLSKGPAAGDDDSADYRGAANAKDRTGYVLSGPEYLTVFDGRTGRERATVAFEVARGSVAAWGDDYGNRVDRFLAAVAYLDETGLPSLVMARGYYTRSTLTAYNFRGDKLSKLWTFDSDKSPSDARGQPFTGQGAHSMSVANVDDDASQELIYGAMRIDHDGKGMCSTGYGHGDALHVSDFLPARAGLEVFMPNEDGAHPSYHLTDARSCAAITLGPVLAGKDTGRGVAADISARYAGSEFWAAGSALLAAENGRELGAAPSSCNFLIWWDADDVRELADGVSITKYGGDSLLSCATCAANNGSKGTPTLTADLFGDHREEIIWREADNRALRIYTTSELSSRRLFTLMHDPQYRVAVAWQNCAYNQPPHTSFYFGADMADPPAPSIRTR